MAQNIGNLEIKLFANLARLQSDMNKANRTVDGAMNKISRSVQVATRAFGGLAAAFGVRELAKMADQYTKMSAQLRIATKSQEEYNQAFKNVSAIAKTAQADITAIGTTYSRLAQALQDVGVTQKQVSNVTETLALALKVNGATAEETASVMLQLSQAFGKGKLDGDEFRSAMEAAPNVMRELAKSMGVPFGALKDLAKQGEITSEVMLKAFNNPDLIAGLREQAKETKTIDGAWQTFTNRLTVAIGKINEATGASKILIGFLEKAATLLSVFQGGEEGSILRNFLDTGEKRINDQAAAMSTGELKEAAKWYGWAREALKVRQAKNEALTLGGILPNDSMSPFNSGRTGTTNDELGIVVTDMADVRKRANEAKQISDRLNQDRVRAAEERAKKEQELQLFLYKEEVRLATEAREWKQKQDEELQETRQKWIDLEQKRADENFKEAQAANAKFEEERRREAERTSDIVTRSLTDALLRGFESGKSFAENFIDTLKNMFKTLVLQPIVKFLVDSSGITRVLGALGGAFSGSASASGVAEGGNSIMGALGGIKDTLSSLNGSLVGSIENLGVFLSTGNGGLGDAIGGFLGQYSSQIADVLPYAGAALQLLSGDVKGGLITGGLTAVGTAIGGPVGGAIGAALGGLFGGFGSKERAKIFSSTARSTYEGGVAISTDYSPYASGRRFKPLGAESSLKGLTDAFAGSLTAIFSEYGINDRINADSIVAQRKGTARGIFAANYNGGSYYYDQGGDGTAQDAFNKMMEVVLSQGVLTGIRQSTLPKSIKALFDGLTTKEQVGDAITSIIAMRKALGDLPPVFDAIRQVVDGVANFSTGIEQLKATYANTQQFVNLFYSDAEKLDITFKQLTTQFSAINQILPDSREGFRALVDNFSVFDEATFNTYSTLVALAPALDAYYQALEQQANGIDEVNRALADGLDQRLFSTYADYVSGQANILAGGDAGGFMARINNPVAMNQEMAEEMKMLRSENAETKLILEKIAFNTGYTAKTNKQWNGDGLPETRPY